VAMDLARIRREAADAQTHFSLVELRPTADGNVYVKTAIQTAAGKYYVLSIKFPDTYPNEMPRVLVDAPSLATDAPHRYNVGHICYLHPSMWNPGSHHLSFVIWRAAKWLNKYDVWCVKRKWPGAEIKH
jgi:ubiquitin-protein ligase